MAKTHFVKAFRGQQKCQWTGGCKICNYGEDDKLHLQEIRDGFWHFLVEDGHRFSEGSKCGQSLNAHLYRTMDDRNPYGLTNSKEWTIDDHAFTQKPLRCQHCGEPINIGDPYKWVAPRAYRGGRGRRMNRHTTCPPWRASELTSSQHLAVVYAAQEGAEDALSKLSTPEDPDDAEAFLDELRGIAEQFADEIGAAVESYRESAQAIEDGFQHPTYQSEELNEKAEDLESWAEEVQYWQGEDFDGEDLEDWADSQVGELEELVGNSPL